MTDKKKKFSINKALLAGGVAAGALGLGCTEPPEVVISRPEVIANPGPVEYDMPADTYDDDLHISVNPAFDFGVEEPDASDMDTSYVSELDPVVVINPAPDLGLPPSDMTPDASDATEDAGD